MMTMDEEDGQHFKSFNELRAKFDQQQQQQQQLALDSGASTSTTNGNSDEKRKHHQPHTEHELTASCVISKWEQYASVSILKKCSSELLPPPNVVKPPLPKKPDFLKSTQNDRASSVQEMIERLNNSNIPLAGPFLANRDANESQSNASTSELSDVSDEPALKTTARSNSFMQYGSMHRKIIDEMRASGHFKKIPSLKSNLPKEIGQVRTQRTRQVIAQLPSTSDQNHLNIDSWCSSATNSVYSNGENGHSSPNKPASIIGSSSTGSDDTMFETYEYYGRDEKENQRCAELHGVVYEICCRQRTFLRLLINICRELLPYIKKFDEKSNHKAFERTANGPPHVLEKLSRQLDPIVKVHEVLYEEFSKKFSNWSALTPDFADVFVKRADFLKICSGFLLAKRDLAEELLKSMEQNKYLAQAIRLFEEEILNAPESGQSASNSSLSFPSGGGISLVMHLDAVHQNVVRYILLMERYRKLLPAGIAECETADKAINKLKSVSEAINCSLEDPDYKNKLMEMHRKIQNAFDVMAPTRRLIHDSRLKKQTARNDLQERHLVLFSDWILVCRYAYPWDYFDTVKTYKIPIHEVEVHINDHVDHEKEFDLKNPSKSIRLVADSKEARDEWVKLINETKRRWMDTERKLQEQQRKLSAAPGRKVSSVSVADDMTPTDPNIGFLTLKDQAPTSPSAKNAVELDPLWVPDSKSNTCMMAECHVKFTLMRRRHHCRKCGDLICGSCMGKAPVKVKNYERDNVCSECYDTILAAFTKLDYFPTGMVEVVGVHNAVDDKSNSKGAVHPTTDNHQKNGNNVAVSRTRLLEILHENPFSDAVRIRYSNGIRSMHPRDLFEEPANRHYHRSSTLKTIVDTTQLGGAETTLLISGKVHLSQKKGHTQMRWARLGSDYLLNFYEAELDAIATESFVVYGYNVLIRENPGKGSEFVLLHQNQVKTERKDLRVAFLIEHEAAVEKWKEAFVGALGLPFVETNGNTDP